MTEDGKLKKPAMKLVPLFPLFYGDVLPEQNRAGYLEISQWQDKQCHAEFVAGQSEHKIPEFFRSFDQNRARHGDGDPSLGVLWENWL